MSVGIDYIAIHIPRIYLDMPKTMSEITKSMPETYQKPREPSYFTNGIGIHKSSLPDKHEDLTTMCANACLKLLKESKTKPNEIGRWEIGNETVTDGSKAVTSYVSGCLEQIYGKGVFDYVAKSENKFACAGGTIAVDNAVNWIKSGKGKGKKAIVCAGDIALYERGDPGEFTQGAGAVAMLISEDPGLIEIEDAQGWCSRDKNDFLKPEVSKYPSVDGKFSIQTYLDAMRDATIVYGNNAIEEGLLTKNDMPIDNFERILFHVPFPKMAEKAGAAGYIHALRGTKEGKLLEKEVGPEPIKKPKMNEKETSDYTYALNEFRKNVSKTKRFQDFYTEKIHPSLILGMYIGNIYAGSVHLARASVFEHAKLNKVDMSGYRLLVGSYGSGLQAEVHGERVVENYKKVAKKFNFSKLLESRKSLSPKQYEKVHDGTLKRSIVEPKNEFVWTGFGKMGERTYKFV